MPKIEKLPVVMIVDSVGDYGTGRDLDEAKADYENNIQEIGSTEGFRVVNLTVKVALPEPVDSELRNLMIAASARGRGEEIDRVFRDAIPME